MRKKRTPRTAETPVVGEQPARPVANGRPPHGAPAVADAEGKRLCPSLERQREERRLSKEQARDLTEARKGSNWAGKAEWQPGSHRRPDGRFVLVYPDGHQMVVGPL